MPVKAMAHITGGGLPENLERLLGDHGAALEIPEWKLGAIPKILEHVDIQDKFDTFNMGYGWVAIVPADEADRGLALGVGAKILGEVGSQGVTVEVRD